MRQAELPYDHSRMPREKTNFSCKWKFRASENWTPSPEFWGIVNHLTKEIPDSECEERSDDEIQTKENNFEHLAQDEPQETLSGTRESSQQANRIENQHYTRGEEHLPSHVEEENEDSAFD